MGYHDVTVIEGPPSINLEPEENGKCAVYFARSGTRFENKLTLRANNGLSSAVMRVRDSLALSNVTYSPYRLKEKILRFWQKNVVPLTFGTSIVLSALATRVVEVGAIVEGFLVSAWLLILLGKGIVYGDVLRYSDPKTRSEPANLEAFEYLTGCKAHTLYKHLAKLAPHTRTVFLITLVLSGRFGMSFSVPVFFLMLSVMFSAFKWSMKQVTPSWTYHKNVSVSMKGQEDVQPVWLAVRNGSHCTRYPPVLTPGVAVRDEVDGGVIYAWRDNTKLLPNVSFEEEMRMGHVMAEKIGCGEDRRRSTFSKAKVKLRLANPSNAETKHYVEEAKAALMEYEKL